LGLKRKEEIAPERRVPVLNFRDRLINRNKTYKFMRGKSYGRC
jgi:hypothetical protein